MAKFVIECPRCGKYAEASTGLIFGIGKTKKIDCACGYTYSIAANKMAARACPHCGNNVIFDQTKSESALCPVCHNAINTPDNRMNVVEFYCPSCSCRHIADKNAAVFTCTLCGEEINVQQQAAKLKAKNEGVVSLIKYEGDNSTFIWKHPIEDFNLGSQLIVHESQEAIFFRDGRALDLFGAGRYTLTTASLPLLEELYKLPTNADEVFHSEVYFINKTVQMAIKWGTPDKVRFIDPLTGVPLQLGASGEMNIRVADSRKLLLKLVGTTGGIAWDDSAGFSKSLQASFRPLIASAVKTNLPSAIKNEAIDILEIDEKLDIISSALKDKIEAGFEEYGLAIPQFYVTNVVLPEDDPNFKRIRELHTITLQTRVIQAEATVKTAQAQSQAQYRTAEEQSKAAIEAAHREAELQRQQTQTEIARREAERRVIEAQAEAQAMRMAGLTEAEIMQAKGYNQKDVLQAEVQKAYAEGIGNMGPAVSGGGGGSSVVGDMLGLGVGMAAAGAVAPQIGEMMKGFGNPMSGSSAAAPAGGWDCTCGRRGIDGNFCPNCGSKKPEPAGLWDCTCGRRGIDGNFCPNCGSKKPEPAGLWDCSCGRSGIDGSFCPNCGKRKGE